MKHSDGLSEKNQILSSKLVGQIDTKKLTNTKLQNAKHKITRNRQTDSCAHTNYYVSSFNVNTC